MDYDTWKTTDFAAEEAAEHDEGIQSIIEETGCNEEEAEEILKDRLENDFDEPDDFEEYDDSNDP